MRNLSKLLYTAQNPGTKLIAGQEEHWAGQVLVVRIQPLLLLQAVQHPLARLHMHDLMHVNVGGGFGRIDRDLQVLPVALLQPPAGLGVLDALPRRGHLVQRLLHLRLLDKLRHHLPRLVRLGGLPPPVLSADSVRDVVHRGRHHRPRPRFAATSSCSTALALCGRWCSESVRALASGGSLEFIHRLGWNRLGYGEMPEELRVPCDHLEKLHFCAHQ